MEIKIITDTENPLFNRREIESEIHANTIPSRENVRKLLSESLSVSPELIKIKTIEGRFGQKVFLVVANVYSSKEDKDMLELKKKKDLESEKRINESSKISEKSAEDSKETNEKEI